MMRIDQRTNLGSNRSSRLVMLTAMAIACLWCTSASGQSDRVYLNNGDVMSGRLEKVVRQGISFKAGGKTENIPAGDIQKVLLQGDPPGLVKGRQFALEGQYEEALEELKSVDPNDVPRQVIGTEVQFYRLLCQAKLALSGRGDRKSVVAGLRAFAGENSNSWHFYQTAEMLGELALALGDNDRAIAYFKSLASAPTKNTKVRSKYLTGTAKLAKGDTEAAAEDLQQVAGIEADSVALAKTKTLGRIKLAECYAKSGRNDEAIKLADAVLEDLDPLDLELASKVYNSRGMIFEATGDFEGAVLAFLHTELMFNSVPQSHAESLSHLAQLWAKVGKPERGAKAKQELSQRYPGYAQ
ncbi:tetratricopeptide repeat protein [Crateriforma spongiae]|uniref:tetratricopeptide repeat protein n=1 Tax=Crateriforma spongiae TaxID=2724528 RepID=UPI001446CEDF|nr:tetratricopeptide repeat protein [Crateriforma spongiae]